MALGSQQLTCIDWQVLWNWSWFYVTEYSFDKWTVEQPLLEQSYFIRCDWRYISGISYIAVNTSVMGGFSAMRGFNRLVIFGGLFCFGPNQITFIINSLFIIYIYIMRGEIKVWISNLPLLWFFWVWIQRDMLTLPQKKTQQTKQKWDLCFIGSVFELYIYLFFKLLREKIFQGRTLCSWFGKCTSS